MGSTCQWESLHESGYLEFNGYVMVVADIKSVLGVFWQNKGLKLLAKGNLLPVGLYSCLTSLSFPSSFLRLVYGGKP